MFKESKNDWYWTEYFSSALLSEKNVNLDVIPYTDAPLVTKNNLMRVMPPSHMSFLHFEGWFQKKKICYQP
jgi:hypothetical protein